MTIGLKDLHRAKRALHEHCRLHLSQRAATCEECHEAAVRQMEKQWRRQREVAHQDYLQRVFGGTEK